MLRGPISIALFGIFLSATALPAPVRAQIAASDGTMFELTLPGGVGAALGALGDVAASPDRSQFLLEFIRRHHNHPGGSRGRIEHVTVRALAAHLERAGSQPMAGASDTLPLPLPPSIWIDVVFRGQVTPATLAHAIVQSRGASLLYYGLMSLDDETRAWIATKPELLGELVSNLSPAFVQAAPALRVSGGSVSVPGGEPAIAIWAALAGHDVADPAGFIRALLARHEGRLAYFFGSLAPLTPEQIAVVLGLDAADPAERISTARRMLALFARLGWDWKVDARTFWRPPFDPALLVAELPVDTRGRPVLPATSTFWRLVFADAGRGLSVAVADGDARAALLGAPVEFAWLCEQVFDPAALGHGRYQLVLFASRLLPRVTPDTSLDAIDTVRAAAAYPALTAALERARLDDVRAFAAASRRAARLSAIKDRTRAGRALAQFQGALVILTRAASRGSLHGDALAGAVSSLAAVDVTGRGEYDGRLVRWIDAHLRSMAADGQTAAFANAARGTHQDLRDDADGHLVRAIAGAPPRDPLFVDWEGTRYRVDLAHAEATRLVRHLGHGARPYVSSALTLVATADAVEEGLDPEGLSDAAANLERAAGLVGSTTGRPSGAIAAFRRSAGNRDVRAAARLAPDLRALADDLLARGLVKLAYAAVLGDPERTSISAGEAADRHDFGLESAARRTAPWQQPVDRADAIRSWRVTGSLLGLDVRLAELSLVHRTSRPPSKPPTLNEHDRRLLIEVVALVDPASLRDVDRDTIAAAMANGRTRLAAVGTPRDAFELGREIRLSPARLSLLPWIMAHDPERLRRFFSPSELLWIGLGPRGIDAGLHAFGAPGRTRLGCLCLHLTDRRPWETFSGRWNSGIFASGFPDLNLRLAELLAELQMPAPLLGPVLAAATLDLVNMAVSGDQDDRRGLVEFVHDLRLERVEEYLALLTTDGPLVPVGEAALADAGGGETVRP